MRDRSVEGWSPVSHPLKVKVRTYVLFLKVKRTRTFQKGGLKTCWSMTSNKFRTGFCEGFSSRGNGRSISSRCDSIGGQLKGKGNKHFESYIFVCYLWLKCWSTSYVFVEELRTFNLTLLAPLTIRCKPHHVWDP